jgi:hypothetical protein
MDFAITQISPKPFGRSILKIVQPDRAKDELEDPNTEHHIE